MGSQEEIQQEENQQHPRRCFQAAPPHHRFLQQDPLTKLSRHPIRRRSLLPAADTLELKQGVLFLGGFGSETTSDFLATGSLQWQQGPRLPQYMSDFCAVPVTESSFITISYDITI